MGSVDVPKFVRDRMKEQIQNGKKPPESNVPSFVKKKEPASEDLPKPAATTSEPSPAGTDNIPQSLYPFQFPLGSQETANKSFLDIDIESRAGNYLLPKESVEITKARIKSNPNGLAEYSQKRLQELNKNIEAAKIDLAKVNDLARTPQAGQLGNTPIKEQLAPLEKSLAEANQYKSRLKNSIAAEAAKTFIPMALAEGPRFDPTKLARQIVQVADPEQELIFQEAEKGGSTLPGITQANLEMMGLEITEGYVKSQPQTDETAAILKNIEEKKTSFDDRNPELVAQRVREKLGVYFYNKGKGGFFGYSGRNIESAINDPETGLTPSEKKVAINSVLPVENKLIFSTEIPGSGFFRSFKNAIDKSLENTRNSVIGAFGQRDDSDRAQDLLNNEVEQSRFRQPGENPTWKQELAYLNNKPELTAEEKKQKVNLEKYVDVRSWNSKLMDGMGDLTGQVAEMALLTKGIGAAGKAITAFSEGGGILSGLTTGAIGTALSNETVGLFITSYLNAYDNYRTQALQLMPGDENAANRKAYATVMGGIEGLSERIFNDTKILKAFTKGVAPSVADITNRFINKEITQQVARQELQSTLRQYLKPFGKQFIKSEVEEPTEESVVDYADGMAQSIFGGQPFDINKTGNKAFNTFLTTAINSPLVSGLAAHGAVNQNQTQNAFMKSAIVDMANNPTAYLKSVEDLRLTNQITQDEANEKIQLIKSSAKFLKEMPASIPVSKKTDGETTVENKELDYPEASSYLLHRLNEAIVNKQLESNNDEALKPVLEQQVKRSVEIRKGIIDGSIGVTPDLEPITDNEKKAQELGIADANTVPSDQLIGTPFQEAQKAKRQEEAKKEVVEADDNITVGEMVDKVGTYKGQRGRFYQDGQTVVFKVEGQPKEYEVGNIDEVKDTPINKFDIAHEESVVSVSDAGELTVRGENFKNNFSDPTEAINYDNNGNVVSVNLENDEGKKRTFRGNIAEDLAYQIQLQQISTNDATRESFEDYINQDPESQAEMESETFLEAPAGETTTDNEVVSREKIETKVVETTNPQTEVVSNEGDFTSKVGNKVVDEKGEPLIVYRSQEDDRQQGVERQAKHYGIYFSQNKESTKIYGAGTKAYHVNLKNPKVLTGTEWNLSVIPEYLFNKLKADGYDGAIWMRNGEMYEVVAFDKSQIKEANEQNKPIQQQEAVSNEKKAVKKKKSKDEIPATTRQSEAKKLYKDIGEIDDPTDARGMALAYIAAGNKINEASIDEVAGRVKKARLNTGEKEKKSGEVKARDYASKDGLTITEAAHSIWDNLSDEIQANVSDRDIINELIDVVNSHNTRLSAAKEFQKRYEIGTVKANLTAEEAAEVDDIMIAKVLKYIEQFPENQQEQLLPLLTKYQDKYGEIDWERLKKDSDGFTPEILSLSPENQEALDGIITKNNVQEESAVSGATDKVGVSEEEKGQSPEERLKAAQSAYDKAAAAFKKAEDKISQKQSTQGSLIQSEGAQAQMFGVNRNEAKEILDPLRAKMKETKTELDAAQKEVGATTGQLELPLVTKPSIINGNEEKGSESSQEGREESGQESSEENVKLGEQGGEDTGSVSSPFPTSKKAGDAVRKFADKVRQGKINKLGGFKSLTGFDAVWDASLEVVAKALDGGALIADAIQSGLDYIKGTDWYNNLTDKKDFDQKYRSHMENEIISTANIGTSESFREKVRGAYKQLMDSEIPEKVKEKFREKGNLKYKVSDNGEAQAAGKAVISAFGVDEALSFARQNAFHPSVNSAVFSEAINEFYNKEQSVKSQAKKFEYASRWADTYNEYSELLTASGQFGQYSYQFYKTSQLGFLLSAKERLGERRDHFLAKDEKSLRQAFEELKDLPEFQEIFAKEVQEAAKKSKNEIKKEVRKKINDAFDALKLNKNATYATFVPPPIINGAIEAMKQAVLLGYEVVDVIAEGVKYINARYNEGWNQEKFENDFSSIVENLISENAVKRPSASDQKKILAKWDKRLTKLDPEKRKELLSKVLNEIVKNGGLEYDKFKQMYADALGLPSLTPEMETKLNDLGGKLNEVDIAKANLDNKQTQENVDAFLKAMNEGEKASRQLNDMLGDKGITLDRFLSIAKLNTLGVANLLINPFFNISFMPIRFLESMVKTGLDYGLKYAGFSRSDGLYENTFYKQRGYFKGFGKGFTKSIINLYTGDQQFDYFQKATRQNIQPIESAKEILANYRGTKKLTTSELANAVMEVFPTMGMSAAIISRGLQVGDLPFRFAAERAAAENIAIQRGLVGIKKEAFILNPDEGSKEKITDAGARAVMAQDNLLTGALNRLSNYLKYETQGSKGRQAAVGLGKVVGATTQPFLKIPLNSAMTTLELALPEFALARGFYHAVTGNRDLALSAFARAAVGYALGLALTQMAQAGLVTGTDDDKDKVNASIYKSDYVGDKTLNFTGFKRWILGGSSRFEDGDVTISLNMLGVPGAIMQMQAQKYDKMSPEQWAQEGYFANLWERAEGSFVNGLKNNVFGNASSLFSAINDGSTYGMNKWLRGSSNVLLNAFEPQWLSTASRISDKYKPDYSAMNLPQQMAATLKERFWNGDDLPKQITVWGQKRTDAPKGINPFLYYYVDITKSRNVDVNDFGFNILGLYNRTKNDAVIPSRPQKTLNENGQYVRLSPLQYEDLQIMVGTQRQQLVKALMNTTVYNDLDDEVKIELLKKQYQNGFKLGERQFWFKHPDLLPPKKKK